MSDFLSRLVARNGGEQAAVRPRIAPAFAQSTVSGERSPAGDILEGATHMPRAISPLVTERAQQTPSMRSQREEPRDAPFTTHRDVITRFDDSGRPARAHERETEDDTRETPVRSAADKFEVAPPSSSLPIRVERHEAIAASAKRPEIPLPPPSVLREIRVTREVVTEQHSAAKPKEAPQDARVQHAVRPAMNKTATPLETPRTKSTKAPEIIHVTIGKIEVRASLTASKASDKRTGSSAMTLDEYQRQRSRRSVG